MLARMSSNFEEIKRVIDIDSYLQIVTLLRYEMWVLLKNKSAGIGKNKHLKAAWLTYHQIEY